MYYPIILIPDQEQGGFTVLAPDLPGLVTEGESMEEALANLQEAAELYLDDADEAPAPSTLETVMEHEEVREHGATVAFADIDTSFLDRRPIRLNVSLPAGLVKRMDEAARKRGMTRSGYLAWAADLAMMERRKAC